MKTPKRYLCPWDYMADPSVHVWDGRLYIYPSHDWEPADFVENDNGDHFNMKDYHVLSLEGDPMTAEVVDHGKVLDVADIPWAGRQLWDCEVARKDGKYYMYFPLKDRNDIFRLGVAISDKPEGPFIPQPDPVRGSYSIDYAVFEEDGEYYLYFGGLWGGQLQRYQDNKALENAYLPEGKEPALPSRVVRLSEDMLVRILHEPQNAILRQYEALLELDEVKLEFEDEALRAIARKALERDTGARALRSIIEEFMMDIMYEIPKDDSIGRVIITKEYIEHTGGPKIMLRGQ